MTRHFSPDSLTDARPCTLRAAVSFTNWYLCRVSPWARLGRHMPVIASQVASQINIFLLAGYETTASALAFTAYYIAQNPDKEAKLLAEIDAFGRDAHPG